MEPWDRSYRDDKYKNKPLSQKLIAAVIIFYAGFAICATSAIAECVTIPLADKLRRRRTRRNEGW